MELKSSESLSALEPLRHAAAHEPPTVVIESEESGVELGLRDLWQYRELLYFLTWRDIKVRYKQTLMGALWVVVQPLAQMFLFTLILHRFAGLNAGELPYPLFVFTGLLVWTFFSNAVLNSTHSLVTNTNLITKVYFPRVFIPAAAVAAGVLDLAIASVVLVGLVIYYGVAPGWNLLLLPLFVALAVLLAFGVGALVSATTVKYRDLRHALPFTLQFWMFATPVVYPADVLQGRWRDVLRLNPMTGIVEGFRAALTGAQPDLRAIIFAVAATLIIVAVSFYVFRRIEETFADVI